MYIIGFSEAEERERKGMKIYLKKKMAENHFLFCGKNQIFRSRNLRVPRKDISKETHTTTHFSYIVRS